MRMELAVAEDVDDVVVAAGGGFHDREEAGVVDSESRRHAGWPRREVEAVGETVDVEITGQNEPIPRRGGSCSSRSRKPREGTARLSRPDDDGATAARVWPAVLRRPRPSGPRHLSTSNA